MGDALGGAGGCGGSMASSSSLGADPTTAGGARGPRASAPAQLLQPLLQGSFHPASATAERQRAARAAASPITEAQTPLLPSTPTAPRLWLHSLARRLSGTQATDTSPSSVPVLTRGRLCLPLPCPAEKEKLHVKTRSNFAHLFHLNLVFKKIY